MNTQSRFLTLGRVVRFAPALGVLAATACSSGESPTEACERAPSAVASVQAQTSTDKRKQSLYFPEEGIRPTGIIWSNGVMWSNGVLWSNGVIWSNSLPWSNGMLWSNGIMWSNGLPLGVSLRAAGARARLVDSRVLLDGSELREGARMEAVLPGGSRAPLDVVHRETSPNDPSIVLYELAHDGVNVCGSDGRGVFLDGLWDARGARTDSPRSADGGLDVVSFACTGGAIAKCVLGGFKPWTVGKDTHQACTRMVRADYCGDGTGHTRNGTSIEVVDGLGVAGSPERADFQFEAAWGPQGAVCVNRTRFVDIQDGRGVRMPSCWADKPRCATWPDAQAKGATLGNASLPATRRICAG